MQKPPSKSPASSFTKYLMAGSGLAMLVVSGAASAQEAASKKDEEVETVIVVGSRASQQSAIDRKKKARTAQDSIVADDVGSFPDRNLNEALSRIPGMAITRNGAGEGDGVSLRGNGPDLTRVEMDGMGVMSSGFDVAVSGASGGGRSADLRELPADLIKSVDVVKGNTPDMTEGGLGGSVLIKTRSGLDFKKPYFQMRVAGDRNSLSQKWSPDINIVASRKFFDNRLGVIFNMNKSRRLNDSHALNNAGTNNRAGYTRFADFDNSPDKTFTFNPSLVSGSTANVPVLQSPLAAAPTTFFNSATPVEILTKSAAAKTKAECLSAFPTLTDAQLNTIQAGSNNATRQAAQAQRINEQITCLNQWNDYAPNLVRDQRLTQYEDRLAWDFRVDYRVTDHLSVYAKYQVTDRTQREDNRQRTRGGVTSISTPTVGFVTQSLTTNTNIPTSSMNVLTPVAGSGYYIYNSGMPTTSAVFDQTLGGSTVNMSFPTSGVAVNVVPGSIVMDKNHHLTQFDITNGTVGIDHIRNDQVWKNNYLLTGGEYKNGPLLIEFQASQADASYSRYDKRVSRSYNYGNATMRVLPGSGIWTFDLPATFDQDNMSNFVQLAAPTAVGQPAYATYGIQYNPRRTESEELQAKFDLTYRIDDQLPFFKRFKTGASYRELTTDYWGAGGYIPKPGVSVPTNTLRGVVRACENVATTTAANACAYGYTPNAVTGTTTNWLFGTETLTRDQMIAIWNNSLEKNADTFMNGYEGVEGLTNWSSIDVDKFYAQLASTGNYNFDCLKICKGSDGNLYEQPKSNSVETITAAYYMIDFEQKLPFNMEFGGNFGMRMVKSEVTGSGYVGLSSIRKTAAFNPANPNLAAGITTTTITKPVYIDKSYTDWLPSYNAYLWVIPDQVVMRYSWSKTVARPPVGRLWPAGTCTNDERNEGVFDADGSVRDMTCTTFGNPDLKPYQATKNNTSLEWYPNKDTSISLAYYRQKVRVGAPITVQRTNISVFAGTDEVDPVTGAPLSALDFTYNTYVNGPGYVQSGWEFATKTAFTFLPWKLKYTGSDFNVSTTKAGNAVTYIDPITGEGMDPQNQAKYFVNFTLWYDDGKTNARLAYQARDQVFLCVSGCGDTSVNNFPNLNPANLVRLPYNPGEPYFTKAYKYLDAKVTHKLTPNIEFYFEGRNLLKEANVTVGSTNRGFSDISENPWSVAYGGRRFTVGMIYKMN
ncbi:TonB-dependent receptor [Asticcacaulis excentricus]|uniref:TonB-dependent receptor n=1 Tax=Asticcacaulis excentricus (strain ATCC 15261 / DSM 4724 / KCTC 12464 / NCIMB 9791 / VKM B-1370 / CB 48) TaxID=573065 RepID=E8RQ08_ASTEC|nr:TonB-dependent receptor [Asticcacaulis excentricus]ADU12065.1 TonB-dependent receptor [Asticcacaulis excentricus CB 48]